MAITHSPRYMLDLEMPSEQCLFKKSISRIAKFEHWTILFPFFANICSLKSAWENWRKEIVPANIQPEARRVLCAILEEIGAKI